MKTGVVLRCRLATHNKSMTKLSRVGSKFYPLCFCQILFGSVYSWESYHKNNKGELFIETQCIFFGLSYYCRYYRSIFNHFVAINHQI